MPPDVFPLLAILIVFGSFTMIAKWTLEYFRDKRISASQDRSMPVSELQVLIEESVSRATEPLQQQLDRLEERIEQVEEVRGLEQRQHEPRQLTHGRHVEDTASTNDT